MKDGSVGGLLRTALACLNSGALQEAQDLAQQVLARDDRSVGALRILALASEASGDLTRALEAYGAALALAPGDVDLLTGLGRLALDMGMASTAEGILRQVSPDAALGAEPACLLARALEAQGRGEEAVAILTERVKDNPGEAICWNALGLILSDRGDLETAGIFFAEALRLEPQLVPARFNAASLMMTLGDVRGALTTFSDMPKAGLSPRDRANLAFSRACANSRSETFRRAGATIRRGMIRPSPVRRTSIFRGAGGTHRHPSPASGSGSLANRDWETK